jgi:hypothetical protein
MAEYEPEETGPSEVEIRARIWRQRWIIAGCVVAGLAVLAGVIWAIIYLAGNPENAANFRDIFIIFMAVESLIVGAALVVLILQVASLINLLQNEVRPILQATSETVHTLRGTTEFLSENLVEPVIKLNSYLAGLRKFFDLFGSSRK